MKKSFARILGLGLLVAAMVTALWSKPSSPPISGAPPYGEPESEVPALDPYGIANWQRPNGPAKVGLQVGHWKNAEVPEELDRIRGNTGSTGGGKSEWEVNFAIAEATAEILQAKGITVDILPATVPPRYWADVFVAIHADGSTSPATSGYKVAPPWRSLTGKAQQLSDAIQTAYGSTTELPLDANISRNMRGYYAFAFWRFEHAVHPMTTAAILETGFLTSPHDRRIIVEQPQFAAQGLAEGILVYLQQEELIPA